MATHDYVIANGTGAAVRSDLNDALAAIVSNNSGTSEPATTYAYQWWADTTANVLKIRNSANNAWITLRELDGTLLMEDGSNSAPGLAFASDLDTGFFRSASNRLNIATGGTERLELGSSEAVFNDPSDDYDFRVESNNSTHMLFVDAGNDRVGIGVSAPNRKLQVNGATAITNSGDTGAFLFDPASSVNTLLSRAGQSSTTAVDLAVKMGNSEALRIDSSGRLLVGTSSARANFYNTTNTANILLEGLNSTDSTIAAVSNKLNTDPNNEPTFVLGRSGTDSLGSTTIVANNNAVGRVSFQGTDGSDFVELAYIRGLVDGTPGSNDMPGRIVLATTADGASSPTERMRIDSSGHVSIGTTTAARTFQVGKNGAETFELEPGESSNNNLSLHYNRNSDQFITNEQRALDHRFMYQATEKVRINSNGLTFNGDTADANALDDYEEGTFTPTLDVAGSSGTLSVSYASQTGRYIKVGRTVFFTIDIRLSNFSRGTGTGGIIVFGLPHVPVNSSNHARSNGFAHLYNWNYSSTAADIPLFSIRQTGNQSYMDLRNHRLNATDADVNDPDNDSMVFLTGIYETVS